MKKCALLLLPLVAAISCSKSSADPEKPVDPTIPVETSLIAYKADGAIWSETDEILVASKTCPAAKFTISLEKGLSANADSANFVGETAPVGPWYAASPESAFKCKKTAEFEYEIPNTQVTAVGANPDAYYLAYWDKGNSVCFNPIRAIVALNLLGEGEVKSLEVTDLSENAQLYGAAKANFDSTGVSYDFIEDVVGNNTITVNLTKAAKLDAKNLTNVKIAVPSGAFKSGIKVSAYNANKALIKTLVLMGDYTASIGSKSEITVDFLSSPFSGGEGTEANPFYITSSSDLLKMAELFNDKENKVANEKYIKGHYKMMSDIDMKGVEFTNISYDYDDDDYSFSGVFDGCNYTIYDLTPNPVAGGPVGLFGYICGGTVKNLNMSGANVSGKDKAGAIAGAAWYGAKIINCSVEKSSVSTTDGLCGGVVGYLVGSTAEDCYAESVSVVSKGDKNVGGLFGYIRKAATVRNCRAVNCEVSCDTNMGGIVGVADEESIIEACTVNACDISGKEYVGGIVGAPKGGLYKNCVVKGSTKITSTADSCGGIAGGAEEMNVVFDHCFVEDGTIVKGLYYVGGIIGFMEPNENTICVIKNCGFEDSFAKSVKADGGDGDSDACNGGIVGWLSNYYAGGGLKLLNCYSYPAEGGFATDNVLTAPSIAGIAGYLRQRTDQGGVIEVAGNCTDVARTDMVFGGKVFKQGEDLVAGDCVGAIFGYAHNRKTVVFKNNYWVDDTGMNIIGCYGDNQIIENNEHFSTAVFEDGTTVLAKLNAFASGYKGETLSSWTIRNKRPVIAR